jgi:hypothetical protein
MSRIEARIRTIWKWALLTWVIDPQTEQAYVATAADELREVKSDALATANSAFELPLAETFR